jgi:hypothetical protein
MPTTYKILGQKTAANAWTDLYVPGSSPATSSVISSIVVCNSGSFDRKFSVAVVPSSGVTPTVSSSLASNTTVIANDSIVLSLGITLGPGNALRVFASSSAATDVGFSAFGTEIT